MRFTCSAAAAVTSRIIKRRGAATEQIIRPSDACRQNTGGVSRFTRQTSESEFCVGAAEAFVATRPVPKSLLAILLTLLQRTIGAEAQSPPLVIRFVVGLLLLHNSSINHGRKQSYRHADLPAIYCTNSLPLITL